MPPMFPLVQFTALALSVAPLINAVTIGPVSDLVIGNARIQPDGVPRSTVLAGGTFPGPVIRGKKGDEFQLNVINTLTDDTMELSTSIHWHGIFQKGTNWADGPAFVTQCPIASNNSFLYQFTVPEQTGTYWYHSHHSTQYCDGLRGAFIVEDPDDTHKLLYDVDDESTIITLADWYHIPAKEALVVGQLPPLSNATLINGKGRSEDHLDWGLSVIRVQQNRRYRFRIISMSCDPNFTFSIDQHMLTVIEADGENTLRHEVDSLQIFAGQRYSVIMSADQDIGAYWIRAKPNRARTLDFTGGMNTAILRYDGAPENPSTDPTKPPDLTQPLKETDLHPLSNPAAPGEPYPGGADIVINLPHSFNATTFHYEMGGVTWVPPTVPVLLQILSGVHSAQDLMPAGSVHELPRNKVIELVLPGTGLNQGGPHPFHLHGHAFSVVRSAGSEDYNFVDPVRRDTFDTGLEGDAATIRFVTDNAGPWFLHCHIDWHLELGLAAVFAEDIPNTERENPVPPAWRDLCPK